jgi:SSS family solute:Na+ symporter
MKKDVIVFSCTIAYIVVTSLVSMWSVRKTKDTTSFMTASHALGAYLVGLLLMSELIGPASSIGTAQGAYEKGLSVAWNSSSLAFGFLLYAFFIAPRMNKLGEYTISGALATHYGARIRLLVSLTMICALTAVNVSAFTGGGAAVGALLHVSVHTAIWIVGIVAILNVSFGGMRGTGQANLIHVAFKFAGLFVIAGTAIVMLAHNPKAISAIPRSHLTLFEGVGYPTLVSWLIGNIGAIFVTQYVLQVISGLRTPKDARKAAIVASVVIFPIGFISAFIGIAAKVLFPHIKSIMALPAFFDVMNPWLLAVAASAMVACTFVTILACQLGTTALLIKDFYIPLFKPEKKHEIWATRIMSVATGLLPIPCALLVPGIIKTIFFARSLRLTLAVLLMFMLFSPKTASKNGGLVGLAASLIATIGWLLLGNPYGLDSMYVALVVPAAVIVAFHLWDKMRGPNRPADMMVVPGSAGSAEVEVGAGVERVR